MPDPKSQTPSPIAPGARALVVGTAKSGLASVELLVRHGAEVTATDLKRSPEAERALEELHVPFELQSETVFERADLIVLSPGVPADLEPLEAARRRGATVIGEVELASYFLQGPIIGITGSNGKTTTTALVGHILRESAMAAQVGGNIGTPVTAMIGSSRPEQWNVLELSSFQLETICRFRAQIAVALNVTPDHLDRHHTFEKYAAAKGRLFETQQPGDCAVLNADDPVCVQYAALSEASALWFGSTRRVTPGVWLRSGEIWFENERLMPASEIPIRGMHNVENTMAAAAACRTAGASLAQIAAAVRTFRAVEHRLEFVRNVSGVDFYNDSKATNVDATLKALDAFPGGLWVILGGKDKGSDYTVLRKPLAEKARAVLLIGAAAAKIRGQIEGFVPLEDAKTLDAAVRDAYAAARPGETVLLAPACASFDQFDNFEHRGRVFKSLVAELEPKP
ncbi:MAG TPA: UDP-N-acetylmuramoyl-L-alanine--D-glutamate ligase [Bryobacteraceae bacterium]|nr:UDP-N-acetylmuramoyl-L-alanine--D-glutamate ligase [Bryobacteraceae bacterium]